MDYINKIETLDMGGGESVDFVRLKGGRVIGINDESVVVYRDWQHWLDGDCEEMIWLSKPKPEPVYSAYWGIGYGEPKCESHELSWFVTDRGYKPEDITQIQEMAVGEKIDLTDLIGNEHFIVRIK
jgi:hypothetical protein